MKQYLIKAWEWLKSVFVKDENKSTLLKVLVEGLDDPSLDVIKDPNLGAKAVQFVKELNKRDDLTGKQKAEIFNEKFAEYAKKVGKVVHTVAINLLRELAVTAVKIAVTNAVAAIVLAKSEENLILEEEGE